MDGVNHEEIEDTALLAIHVANLCMNEDKADVTIVVEDERIPAHRLILASRSEYFQALLYGGLDETKQNEIKLKVPLQPFKSLLRYIYSGSLSLKEMKDEDTLDTLGLAIQYGFTSVEKAIINFLSLKLTVSNVCAVLDAGRLFDLADLLSVCDKFVDKHALEVLKHESFLTLTFESLSRLLDRDSFDAQEVDVFNAVHRWYQAKEENKEKYKTIYDKVRFTLIPYKELVAIVRPTGVLSSDRLLDIVMEKEAVQKLRYRGVVPGENVIKGEIVWNYIYEKTVYCADIELDKVHIINRIEVTFKMLFTDRAEYYVDVSLDKKCWERVGEFQHKKATEAIFFRGRTVRYIRVSAAEERKEIEAIKAMLVTKQKKFAAPPASV